MPSCLLLEPSSGAASALIADLEACGIPVLGAVQRGKLVQEVVRAAPDLVVAHEPVTDVALLELFARLAATAPRPVLLFTADPDVDAMTRALACGVHAYVVNGYAAGRLRALAHLAQARFAREESLRTQLEDLASRFEERKVVDRAKGILMRARQLSEDEAFRVLRTASMRSNQRVGQVSRQLVASAGMAEAVNRAGQCRMLSQRLVKLHLLRAAGAAADADAQLEASCTRVDANLAMLSRALSKATFGDLIDALAAPWAALRAGLALPAEPGRVGELDAAAERMLSHAERLVHVLQEAAAHAPLAIINVAGRQRMLSQRVAKQALLAAALPGSAAAAARAEGERAAASFAQGLRQLQEAPLTTREIRAALDEAARLAASMDAACGRVGTPDGARALADTSEALLALFDQLTERYERSMQTLMG